ncbi:MAG: acyltransferase [Roseateles sp.]|nr:MAG: acyltransferase [Roseateles sp.]
MSLQTPSLEMSAASESVSRVSPTPSTAMLSRSLQSLETLRIVAALLVVCAHVPAYDIPVIGWWLGANLFLGSIGVDLFFVISGVVIGLSTVRALSSPSAQRPLAQFLIARAFRIFPLYWIMTAATILLLWRKGLPLPSVPELLHSLTLIPRLDQMQYADPIVHIGWTLQFEVFFYALCALAIAFRAKWLPMVVAVLLAGASLIVDQYYFNPILLEFAGGYALALHLARQSHLSPRLSPVPALLMIVGAVALFLLGATGRDGGYPAELDLGHAPRMVIAFGDVLLPRWIAWGLPAWAVVAVALRLESSFNWRLAFLGKYTYSVYLCHTFAISLALVLPRRAGAEAWMLVLLPVCLLVIASFTYRVIEHPMIRVGKRLADLLKRRPAAS